MSDAATVRPHLLRWFDSHRVVFWHDPDGQYASDLDSLDMADVQTIRVANDEFGVKNRLLHDEPDGKFLVYRSGQVPAGIGNWLLDLELAYGVFTADRSALVAQDLGLADRGVDEVVQEHEKFFNASKRVQSLKALLNPEDDATDLRAKMTAVLLGLKDSHSLLEITRTLLAENAKGQRAKHDALVEYGVDDFYWRGSAASTATSQCRRVSTIWCFGSSARPWTASHQTAGWSAEHPARLRQPCATIGVANR